jgi:VanZ family protein
MILIFYFSSIEYPPTLEIKYSTNYEHTLEYFILGFLLYRGFKNSKYENIAFTLAILIAIVYGISDEMHQYFVPGRSFDFFDMGFNSLGALLIIPIRFLERNRYFRKYFL